MMGYGSSYWPNGGAGFVTVHGKGTKRTIMQLTPGEAPETFVRREDPEPDKVAS